MRAPRDLTIRGVSKGFEVRGAWLSVLEDIDLALPAGSLTAMIGLIHVVGVYFSLPLFILFYMRVLGRHGWRLTGSLATAVSIVTFLFFEGLLKITLPKGYSEELIFIRLGLYDLIY